MEAGKSIKPSLGMGWGEAGKPDSQDTPFEICNFLYPVLKLLSQCKLYILIRPITQWLQYFGLHVNMRVTSLSAVASSRQLERNMFGHEKGRKNKTKASNLKFIQTDLHKMDIWQFHIFWALQTVIWLYPYWQSKGFCSKAESTKIMTLNNLRSPDTKIPVHPNRCEIKLYRDQLWAFLQ